MAWTSCKLLIQHLLKAKITETVWETSQLRKWKMRSRFRDSRQSLRNQVNRRREDFSQNCLELTKTRKRLPLLRASWIKPLVQKVIIRRITITLLMETRGNKLNLSSRSRKRHSSYKVVGIEKGRKGSMSSQGVWERLDQTRRGRRRPQEKTSHSNATSQTTTLRMKMRVSRGRLRSEQVVTWIGRQLG